MDHRHAPGRRLGKGTYLTSDVTGPATIQFVKTAGINAAVSGVFVDEVGKQLVR